MDSFAAVTTLGTKAALLPWHRVATLRPALGLIALLIGVPLGAAAVATLLAATGRRLLRRRRPPQAELLDAAELEDRLRAAMSELCPHGWRAFITLFAPEDELPPDAPAGARSRVALDWAELDSDGNDAVIVRRVWAATVAEAMEAMVADRRTDETLEQIERAAVWPD
ncbi:MAG TPA: hypothetical protein VG321_03250 [Solirubrobacteraceae bacterium]|nr:hypothetical protein [Solirubrobacteraceae bacterium]